MPKPLDGVVDALQASLALHWSQAEMYDLQAVQFTRWGYPKLGETWASYAAEERGHVKMISERLEMFDVQPSPVHSAPELPRHDFDAILDVNYEADLLAAATERAGYMTCASVGDAISAKIFTKLVRGSEDSLANIEAIRTVIEQIGLDNYLASQV
jgi:bacterioferritin (cytochrome b1)